MYVGNDLFAGNNLSAGNDLMAASHGLIGKDVDFSTGGLENFAVGHSHKFYGKESFAVHDGNVVGARGIHWKAIDTTNRLIYLTKPLSAYYNVNAGHNSDTSCVVIKDYAYHSKNPSNDIPYFGPRNGSRLSNDLDPNCLFTADPSINLSVAEGTDITLKNYTHFDQYVRCFKVVEVLSGSVIRYTEDDAVNPITNNDFRRTLFRESNKKGNDSHYLVYFPDCPGVECDPAAVEHAAAFGCAAIGDGNRVVAVNTFAVGLDNNVTAQRSAAIGDSNGLSGSYQYAIGVGNKLTNVGRSIAFGYYLNTTKTNEIALGHYNDSVKSGTAAQKTMFTIGNGESLSSRSNAMVINTNNDVHFPGTNLNGFYIGENDFIQCMYNAVQVSAEAVKSLLGITGIETQMQEINNLADEIIN